MPLARNLALAFEHVIMFSNIRGVVLDGEATAHLRVQLLGEFRCWRVGKLITPMLWKTAKLRALFALFVTERGQVFSQAQLAEQLWPDSEDAHALVRRRISELRHI